MLTPPVLSIFDPRSEGEGSVDPLSLQPIYERLADRMLPAIAVRMRRLRFVTAICAAARVCEGLEETAADGVSPPWLVFEWFVVEALVRQHAERADGGAHGIPGGLKVATALRNRRALGDHTYLKTPTVFGYTGIFRRLVTRLRVLTDDLALDDGAHRLLAAWERDSRLEGFVSGGADTAGGQLRDKLFRAVREGMKAGSTTKRSSEFWQTLAEAFDPDVIGRHERKALFDLLTTDTAGSPGHAQELIRAVRKGGRLIDRASEASFLKSVAREASPELAKVLRAIDAFEALCRPLTDAFDLLRWLSTERGDRPVSRAAFVGDARARRITKALQRGSRRVLADQNLGEWERQAVAWATTLSGVDTAEKAFTATLDHHSAAQKNKPPDGKRDWFERAGAGVIVRHAYALNHLPKDPPYVHQYRIPTLSRFLGELGRLR